MKKGLTPSECLVSGLCERSFLKLWTHPNPKGKNGKELCDCLIVCGPHIVIISVKHNEYRDTGNPTGWERWTKAAIEKSASQIWGAERWMKSARSVERQDGRVISLPLMPSRRYHRLAVALGGKGEVPLKWGDFGNGFVHLCDEYSLEALFTALDTITDFVEFLGASEALVRNGVYPLFAGGGIEDLVALYMMKGRSFDFEVPEQGQPDMLILQDDLWRGFAQSEEFRRMRTDIEVSYAWDRLIDLLAEDLLSGGMFDMHSKEVTNNELALVKMALEPRMNRSVLAKKFIEFFQKPDMRLAARVVQGHSGSAYVFTAGSSQDPEFRLRQLALRCFVVRGRLPNTHTVVGIATDHFGTSKIGYSCGIVYLHIPEWTQEDERKCQGIQKDLGYFESANWSAR